MSSPAIAVHLNGVHVVACDNRPLFTLAVPALARRCRRMPPWPLTLRVACTLERRSFFLPADGLEADPSERAAAKIVEQGRRSARDVRPARLDQVSARGD